MIMQFTQEISGVDCVSSAHGESAENFGPRAPGVGPDNDRGFFFFFISCFCRDLEL